MGELIHENERRPIRAGRTLFEAADELAVRVPSSCRRSGRCRECVVQVHEGAESLAPPTAAEAFLPHGFRLACQAVVARDERNVRFAVLRRRLRILGSPEPGDGAGGDAGADLRAPLELDPVVTREGATALYRGKPVGPAAGRLLGLALDLGTTTVVFELVDLESGRTLEAAAFENPQRFGGSDVMSRIAYEASQPGELRRVLRRALNRELEAAYRRRGVDRHEVLEVVVVGNPTMRDLFFGLDVWPLGRSPFRSLTEQAVREGRAASTSLLRRAHELGVLVHPQGRVYGVPLIACHVGADIAADMVATSFAGRPGVSLLVDIGTNSEMVITDGERTIAASSPAGPAFEGGGVRHGMAGADGAIESMRFESGRFAWRTIGDVPPEGICGSGLVDLLAEIGPGGPDPAQHPLRERGALDSRRARPGHRPRPVRREQPGPGQGRERGWADGSIAPPRPRARGRRPALPRRRLRQRPRRCERAGDRPAGARSAGARRACRQRFAARRESAPALGTSKTRPRGEHRFDRARRA